MSSSEREIYLEMKSLLEHIVDLIETRYNLISDPVTLEGMKSRMEDSVKGLIDHGELILAYDFLVTHLCDLSIPVTREIYKEIERFSLMNRTPPELHHDLVRLGLVIDS